MIMTEDKTKKKLALLICTVIMMTVILIIGPLDMFAHGYYCDEIDFWQIAPEDFIDFIRLEDGDFEMEFTPSRNHFAGFEINLLNQPEGNTGTLVLTVFDSKKRQIDELSADLSKITAGEWYLLYADASLKKGKVYTLRFSAVDCNTIPYLQVINPDYLPEENVSGDILIGYAYAESTFTFQNKILIILFIVAIWGFCCAGFPDDINKKKCIKCIAVFMFMTAILSWNYMYNSMDNNNTVFSDFQSDSEALVSGMIYADQDGVYFHGDNEIGYGLGRYYDVAGEFISYNRTFVSDNDWLEGYSRTQAAIIIGSCSYMRNVAKVGNYVGFDNGELFQIIDVEDDAVNIKVYLNTSKVLSEAKYGSLKNARFYAADIQPLDPSLITAYRSQYGLQGKIFKRMARYMDNENAIANLNLICCIASAVVFVLLVYLIAVKYNHILAGCFFVTFWLSPWIVNFARNLYWVEFTWFIPMIIGLFCSWRLEDKKCRILSYASAFIAITVKCLCGYEYISVVMMGLISFLLVDFAVAVIAKDKQKSRILFRTIFIIGLAALLGFAVAICIHAHLKGNGSLLFGIKKIIEDDVLRRTSGADLNVFNSSEYWLSLNASVWEVLCAYFHFKTEVITGIPANLFPILCIVPICILIYGYRKRKMDVEQCAMYIVSFLTTISWLCLAKAHSYEHRHMNYVLWYFGFVQICFYIIINKILEAFRNVKNPTK